MSFKICTIGCGVLANKAHGPSYKKYAKLNADIELAACCDLDEAKAINFKQKFGFSRYYTDMDVMLDNEKPDAVCLISPAHLTELLSLKVLKRRYPLLLEKPPGMNREETLNMIREAQKNNVPNQVAFNRRFSPFVKRMKVLIEQIDKDDQIQYINYQFGRVGRYDEDFAPTAIHAIDTVKFIANSDYDYVKIDYQHIPGASSNVVNIYLHCHFTSGIRAQINLNPVTGAVIERINVNLLEHSFFVSLPFWTSLDLPGRLVHTFRNETMLDLDGFQISNGNEGFEMNGFYDENETFFNDIKSGRRPVNDIMSGLQSVEICDCIRKRLGEYKTV